MAQSSAQGQSFAGTLYDAMCREQNPRGACAATPSTSSYGLLTQDGKFYKIDAASNTKVQDALRSASSSSNASAEGQEKIQATVDGSVSGDTLTVNTITIH